MVRWVGVGLGGWVGGSGLGGRGMGDARGWAR